ncbi:MAG: DUF3995 domain-containing protein [Saprospiraceae bacterium]|nr:DUF3995 domain-containing protein [Saprospiraceae bacterium]
MTQEVNIIGAGIGGLTTALTLKQKGFNVKIYESSPEIKPVGAGIILANNAMQVFQKLGLQDKIEKAGNKISYMKITDDQLKLLPVVNLSEYEKKYGVSNVAIHRGELQRILANEIGFENIKLSKRLTKIEKNELFKLTFEDNSTIESKIVIGADSIKSVVRNQLFTENTLRNANQNCWRGICEIDLPENYYNELNEAWSKGKRFGFVKISDKKVYWYALTNSKSKTPDNLLEIFKEFHTDIQRIIAATPISQIITSDILDLKPIKKWQDGNVCLVGDSAHATTPNLGQGACQAIEDAYVIGKLLDKGVSIENCFLQYQTIRMKKAHTIVNTSWSLGKLAHIENGLGVKIRNLIMKNMPKSANRKQMDMIFNLNYYDNNNSHNFILIFLFISSIHFYWAFGGNWGSDGVLPTKDDNNTKVLNQSILPTLIVALGLLGFGLLILVMSGLITFDSPQWLSKYGLWIIASIFTLRAIGDFKYVGFFKKIKLTKFGKNDTKYYSPLCLTIGILTLILELMK